MKRPVLFVLLFAAALGACRSFPGKPPPEPGPPQNIAAHSRAQPRGIVE
ncbi:MAG TPA: hypothetical protein VG796_12330 [Verrucomicrobiales bacterium]|nr:hypothetical protein [Verrucomicrobiales bacterium]